MTPQILYISHGGGPLPLLGDPAHAAMVARLDELRAGLRKPSAILVISAHWEAEVPTITAGAAPELIYDYYGFPAQAYEIRYPAPGAPQLAQQIQAALAGSGIHSRLDTERGFDHGLFVPLKLLYPQAEIPCVQLSLVKSLDPRAHLALGAALQTLDCDNLLVIGSGSSFHNMGAFRGPGTAATAARNEAFETWLQATLCDGELSETERAERLLHWEQAPHARFCHPREEHLLPLQVCYGLAQRAADLQLSATILGRQMSMFAWQG